MYLQFVCSFGADGDRDVDADFVVWPGTVCGDGAFI